jgi:carbon monoxide dehydrogenase subunit G
MKLENEFTVPASIEQAWAVLLDVPRVAPCLPGATVEPEVGDDGAYKGSMKIKIGPITATYKGTVKIEEADEAARRVAMRAQAKDARGQGTAAATITSTMEEVEDGTKVSVVTDMRVTGPAAQFGRGVMQDVSAKLMQRFAECLAKEMRGGEAEAEAAVAEAAEAAETAETAAAGQAEPAKPETEVVAGVPGASSGVSSAAAEPAPSASSGISSAEPRPASDNVLDLGEVGREAVLKRAIPLVAGIAALLILIRIIKR